MTNSLTRLFRLSIAMVVMVGFTSALAGCETWKGLGKDVENVGDSMQGGADVLADDLEDPLAEYRDAETGRLDHRRVRGEWPSRVEAASPLPLPLAPQLARGAEHLEAEVDSAVGAGLSLLEPGIIIVMGGLVAGIVLSILLPILRLNTLAMGG